MGFFKNIGRALVREAKKSARRTARKVGTALFSTKPARRTSRRRKARR